MIRVIFLRPRSSAAAAAAVATRRLSTAADSPLPRVASRRVWEAHKAKHAKKAGPKQQQKKEKEEQKPWPTSVLVVGYSAAAIGIPYCIAWFLAINKPVRDVVVSPYFPTLEDRFLRPYFGQKEAMSWQDFRDGVKPVYKLDDEDDSTERRQQELIDSLLAVKDTPVRIRVSSSSNNDSTTISETKRLPGSLLANKTVLLEQVGQKDGVVAIDFADLNNDDDDDNTNNNKDDSTTMDAAMTTTLPIGPKSISQQVYSSWYYQRPSPDLSVQTQQLSWAEIELSRLQYEVEQLDKELKNPMSTRDIDEISKELNKTKSQLRMLQWRKRLGMA